LTYTRPKAEFLFVNNSDLRDILVQWGVTRWTSDNTTNQTLPRKEDIVMQRRLISMTLLLFGTFGVTTAHAADLKAEEQRIRDLDTKWAAAAAAKDVAASAAFYAPDGRIMPSDMPAAVGQAAIGEVWKGWFKLKDVNLTFGPTNITISEAADMAYDIGSWSIAFTGDNGPAKDHGKYVVVWKKVGSDWKVAADIFNSDGPGQ
jgi:ketosteroid isomerase-like protein